MYKRQRSLRALDGVVLVISAREGVQPQTRILFHQLKKMKMPVILFINKTDRVGADYEAVLAQIRTQLSTRIIQMQEVKRTPQQDYAIREYSWADTVYTEQIIMSSDKLLEKYLEGRRTEPEELEACLRFRVGKGRLYPVYAGSALKDLGIEQLMRGIVRWLPVGKPESSRLSAYIYKVEHDDGCLLYTSPSPRDCS